LWKSVRQLGLNQLALFAAYRLGLVSGYYRVRTPAIRAEQEPHHRAHRDHREKQGIYPPETVPWLEQRILCVPEGNALAAVMGERAGEVIQEADEVVAGQARLFGIPSRLQAGSPDGERKALDHWTAFEGKDHPLVAGQDIRLIWEAGRLGWIYPLARATLLTGDDGYAEAFWHHAEAFLSANPPNLGPHWSSGQEVAIRLVGLAFGGQVFAHLAAATPARLAWLGAAIAHHARRIPPTLIYARAQNNNHLVTEALGLYAAGVLLPDEPGAGRWRKLGWRWLNYAFQRQIREDGTYVQHSTNYHRLMLQAALGAWALSQKGGELWPDQSLQRLRLATCWLFARLDPVSGGVPNLGANDGATLFPLDSCGFHDYRPVLQACGRAFLGIDLFQPGPWDEMSLWFGLEPAGRVPDGKIGMSLPAAAAAVAAAARSRLDDPPSQSWASLRAVHFHERPSHSDPLHVELWWRGQNLACDAGTYSYNADPPWDNALVGTRVHNTVQIDRQDPMLRAGRFLWLDWAQARFLERSSDPDRNGERLTAEHSGYARLGVIHERSLTRGGHGTWQVIDRLKPVEPPGGVSGLQEQTPAGPHRAELVWLMPDWPWEMDSSSLRLKSSYGWVQVDVQAGSGRSPGEGERLLLAGQLIRAGEILAGSPPADPIHGWYSPTYGQKQPALTWCIAVESSLPFWFTTQWQLPE